MKRREAEPCRGVRIRAVLQQHLRDIGATGRGGAVQRVDAELVVGEGVHVGAALEEELRRLWTVEEGRVMEGGEVVARTGRCQGRFVVEQLAQPLDISERCRLEHVQLRRVGEGARRVLVAPVESGHDLAHPKRMPLPLGACREGGAAVSVRACYSPPTGGSSSGSAAPYL